ncbi:hypothetical protein MED01_005553 [Micromonospora sp. MED01]|uniref:hypothetical protein n=1 Tax=Micromonospora alfalfae TaxID=2911212 RepID=UPI001EE96969|nr:hypothetical protein [Micromonospora alfalfae]MCG5466519.1 hypothetical protein [Micromonospora alfalfae]
MKKSRKAMFIAAASAALLAVAGSPAQAHDLKATGPWGCGFPPASCGYGELRNNHKELFACDTKADGQSLEVKWEQKDGTFGRLGDPNGSASNCGFRAASGGSSYAKIQVCSDGVVDDIWVCNQWVDA